MVPKLSARRLRIWEIVLVALLLALHWGMATTSSVDKSVTFDEVAHVTGGYFYWTAGDYRFNPESGNLTQRWATLPLLLQDVGVPPPGYPPRRAGNVWSVGRELLFLAGNDTESLVFASRSMIALLSAALGALVYAASRALFGRRGAILSLLLYAWSPTVLAHARLVTADLSATFFFLLSILALARLLERVTAGRLVGAGLAVAGLVLAKMSWLLILPMAALLVVGRLLRRTPWTVSLRDRTWDADSTGRQLAVAVLTFGVVTLLVVTAVWTAYGWRFRAAGDADPGGAFLHSWESRLEGSAAVAPAIRFARDHELLPEAFLWGLAYTLLTTQEREAFLNGETSRTGWRTFFPYAFLVKTPLPFLALLLLAAAAWWRDRIFPDPPRGGRIFALWVLLGVYATAAVASPLNLGHRHLLPIYPVLFILAGRAASWTRGPGQSRTKTAVGGGVLVLLALFVFDSWLVRPHYLSYMNALAGGPANGYRHLVDSSLDWGQDLPALADALEELREGEPETPVYVAYLGAALPDYYGIEARWLHSYFALRVPHPPLPLEGGVYAVSATLLQTVHTGLFGPWTADYEDEYQASRREMTDFWERYREPSDRPRLLAEKEPGDWTTLFKRFNQLRSVRLFHFLRDRPPEGRAGYSILIFRLSQEDVRRAMEGAAARRATHR